MSWRGWIGSLPIIVVWSVGGCESQRASLVAADPGLARTIAETGGGLRSRAHAEEEANEADPPPSQVQTVAGGRFRVWFEVDWRQQEDAAVA